MLIKVGEVVSMLKELEPPTAGRDHLGLQLGDVEGGLNTVLVVLDVDDEAVDLACRLGAGLVVTHYPLFSKPLRTLRRDRPLGCRVMRLVERNISVYTVDLDSVFGGVSDILADLLGLEDRRLLHEAGREYLYKLVVFVPREHVEAVRDALGEAGAGAIGGYSRCTFRTSGQGTFLPGPGTTPYMGEPGRLEHVAEDRLETVVPGSTLAAVLDAMMNAHPYEEPAYDIYRLENHWHTWGSGRVGNLPQPVTLDQLAARVHQLLGGPGISVLGRPEREVSRVAVSGGGGGELIAAAAGQDADVYIAGDLTYHAARQARDLGLALLDPGRIYTEWPVVGRLVQFLGQKLSGRCRVIQGDIPRWWNSGGGLQ